MTSAMALIFSLALVSSAAAFSLPPLADSAGAISRRSILAAPFIVAPILLPSAAHAADAAKEAALLDELKAIRKALEPLPALLDEEKWDNVRSVLKVPPTANLWNLGESKNTLRKLAELREEFEIFELADDVAGALQLADQFTYDNTFIYTQPGNGKVKIKEPKQQVQLASQKLGEVLDKN